MRFEIESSLEQDEAFAAVADFGRLQEWDPAVATSQLLSGTALMPGAIYQLQAPRWLGKTILTYELLEIDIPHFATYRGGSKSVTSTDTIRALPLGYGSRVVVESALLVSGRTRWAAPLIIGLVWLVGRTLSLPALTRRLNPQH